MGESTHATSPHSEHLADAVPDAMPTPRTLLATTGVLRDQLIDRF